ncbi:hypothetical protein OH76DRAFT_1487919 [Lentinus brumalis]|uniref:Uncharacterized protein n=1 Tax=Lentinus brumalis TaxID=2498619 RepID=A0A371CSS2_9APHY|nr:hypothetical protein OH76DRAFT_1487919 [Polyporus brumalis]
MNPLNDLDWENPALYDDPRFLDLDLRGPLPFNPQVPANLLHAPQPSVPLPPPQGWQGAPGDQNIPPLPHSLDPHNQPDWDAVGPPPPPPHTPHTPAGQARGATKFYAYQTPVSQPRIRPVADPSPVAYGYDGPRQTSQAHVPQVSGPVQVLVWDSTVKGRGDREVQETPCRNGRKRPVGSRDSESEEVGEVEELAAGKKAKKTAPKAKAEMKEKGKGKKAQETKPRAGKGSRSGPANRRAGGASDDEVQKLSGAIKRDAEPRLSKAQLKKLQLVMEEDSEAEDDADGQGEGDSEVGSEVDAGEFDESRWGLGPDEKVMAVEYLADPARYASIRTKLGEYCITMAQVLFKGRGVTAEQIRNFWSNNAFKKYKEIRSQLSHTGGGDPDAARMDGDQSTSDLRPEKKSDVTFTRTRAFSASVLLAFYQSKMYDLIDAVAWSDSAVERMRKYNSSDPVSQTKKQRKGDGSSAGGDAESGEPTYMVEAFRQFAERNKATQELERQRLELEKRREAREEEDRKERAEIRRRQDKREAQAAREVQWKRAMDMCASEHALLRDRGLKLMERLEAEEGEE